MTLSGSHDDAFFVVGLSSGPLHQNPPLS